MTDPTKYVIACIVLAFAGIFGMYGAMILWGHPVPR